MLAYILLQSWDLRIEPKMLQQVSEPLRPADRHRPGSISEFLRINPLGEFSKNRRHLIEPARVLHVPQEVERRRLGRRHEECSSRRIEALRRHILDVLAEHE